MRAGLGAEPLLLCICMGMQINIHLPNTEDPAPFAPDTQAIELKWWLLNFWTLT